MQINNVPQGYKQTELGVIPEDWEIMELGRGLRFQVGFPFVSNYFNEDGLGLRLVRNRDLKSDDQIIYHSGSYKPEYVVRNGDVLVGMDGDFLPCLWWKGQALLNQRVGRIIIRTDWNTEFLFYLLFEPLLRKQEVTGATTVKHLSHRDIELMQLPIPPSIEQKSIARALSYVDALIAALDKKIAKKRLIKQGAMQQLLTGRKRLAGFDKAWEIKPMEVWVDAGAISLYRGKVISKKNIEAKPGTYPIYSSSVTNNGYMGSYGAYAFDRELISWSVDGGGNFFYRPKHKFSLTNVCGYMLLDESMFDYRFLAYQLSFLHSKENFDYTSKAHPSVISRIYRIARPEMIEQWSIASLFFDIDRELADLEARRDKYKLIKSGMMQKLLTGQIRLNNH